MTTQVVLSLLALLLFIALLDVAHVLVTARRIVMGRERGRSANLAPSGPGGKRAASGRAPGAPLSRPAGVGLAGIGPVGNQCGVSSADGQPVTRADDGRGGRRLLDARPASAGRR